MSKSQMKIRLPQELKDWIKKKAIGNMRPMNSEIILLLQKAKDQIDEKQKT